MNHSHRPSRRNQEGFALVELLIVMAVIGILAQIAMPNYRAIVIKARAVDVMGDIEVIDQAVRNHQADLLSWPDDAAAGAVPPGLAEYLPEGFSFVGEDFALDWDNYPLTNGLPNDPSARRLLGVGVITANTALAEALVSVFGTNSWYVVGSKFVLIVERE